MKELLKHIRKLNSSLSGPSNGFAPIIIIKSKRYVKNRSNGNFLYMTARLPFQGPKKSWFSRPPPSNGPCNGFVPIKGERSGTKWIYLVPQSPPEVLSVFIYTEQFQKSTAICNVHKMGLRSTNLVPLTSQRYEVYFVQNNLEINSDMWNAEDTPPVHKCSCLCRCAASACVIPPPAVGGGRGGCSERDKTEKEIETERERRGRGGGSGPTSTFHSFTFLSGLWQDGGTVSEPPPPPLPGNWSCCQLLAGFLLLNRRGRKFGD
jgi:hypothetical protein